MPDKNTTMRLNQNELKHLYGRETDTGGWAAHHETIWQNIGKNTPVAAWKDDPIGAEWPRLLPGLSATMMLDDAALGELLRHMSYGGRKGGGYQGRLRKAFSRNIRKMIGEI